MFRLSAVIAGAALSLSLSAGVDASPPQSETLERAVQALEDELVELSSSPQPGGAASAAPPVAFKAADEASWDILIELQNAGTYVPPRALMVLQLTSWLLITITIVPLPFLVACIVVLMSTLKPLV